MKQENAEATTGRRTLLLLVSGILLLTFGWMLSGESLEAKGTDKTAMANEKVAVVAGEVITQSDLEKAAAEPLEQLEMQRMQVEVRLKQQRQEMMKQTLDTLVEDKLMELEAKARKISKDDLVKQEITDKVAPVTDADVDTFYEQIKKQRPGQGLPPEERIAPQIKSHLEQQRQQDAREAFMKTLKDKYKVALYWSEPKVEVSTTGEPARGPKDAPVTIVEFSDFQCPFCSRVKPTLDQVLAKYGDKVRLVYRQFPLGMHQHAKKAAEASLCAFEQGKFWEMYDAMFKDQSKLAVTDLKATAKGLGMDSAKFDGCLDSGKYEAKVKDDIKAGIQAGVSGTPALFINGRFLNGAQPYDAIAKVIDEELAKANKS